MNDESLSGPAARALSAIRTDNAKKVLVASLMRRSGTPKTQKDIIRAIADVQIADAENVLKHAIRSISFRNRSGFIGNVGNFRWCNSWAGVIAE